MPFIKNPTRFFNQFVYTEFSMHPPCSWYLRRAGFCQNINRSLWVKVWHYIGIQKNETYNLQEKNQMCEVVNVCQQQQKKFLEIVAVL